jgi:hypothetical protein
MADTVTSLKELSADFVSQRDDLHRLAYAVIAETRRRANGRFGLVATPGGFGTPEFDGARVRVEGHEVIVESAAEVKRFPITSLAETAALLGIEPGTDASEHDSPPLGDTAAPLTFDSETVSILGAWFELGTSALEELRTSTEAVDPGTVQLWPGHFDAATEIGDLDAGRRATYGTSPGDAHHPEPYLYVGAWGEVDRSDSYWNDPNFSGASITYAELRAADDPRAVAMEFFRGGLARLNS